MIGIDWSAEALEEYRERYENKVLGDATLTVYYCPPQPLHRIELCINGNGDVPSAEEP